MDREQPILESSSPISEENFNSAAGDETLNGSLNKFKDAKSLEEAYINLQSEFTRKCQRLSDLEKLNQKQQNDNLTEIKTEVKPFYESEKWNEEVAGFLKNNPNAKKCAGEIVDIIVKDKVLQNLPNSLEIAYNKILAQSYKSEEDLAVDETFIEKYIVSNKKITDKIINNYIQKLKQNSAPQVINTSKYSSFGLTPNLKPKNLEEAKKLAADMFKK